MREEKEKKKEFNCCEIPFSCTTFTPVCLTFRSAAMDIGGLETVVANSAYVSARGSVDGAAAATMRDKKMRARLNLPHIRDCEATKATVDKTFDSMCVKQPIGKRLFQQFLESDAANVNAGDLWKDLEDYTISQEKDRLQKAQKIVKKYYESSSKNFCSFLEEKAVTRVKEDHKNLRSDLFKESEKQLLAHLEKSAVGPFVSSMYFLRYVQFKWLENQPIDEEWFMDFRVLGKGGFGEVFACQAKATGKMYANKKLEKKRLKKRKGYEVMSTLVNETKRNDANLKLFKVKQAQGLKIGGCTLCKIIKKNL